MGLFFGGAGAGLVLAERLARGSWPAEFVSFFALPLAFAVGLQSWLGLALLVEAGRWLRSGRSAGARRRGAPGEPGSPAGSVVFLPLGSAAGILAGIVVGLLSPTHPAWQVALAYWLVGTLHGLLAWRLARAGFLLLPDGG
jgi:hypothetical protein